MCKLATWTRLSASDRRPHHRASAELGQRCHQRRLHQLSYHDITIPHFPPLFSQKERYELLFICNGRF
jgi:hypothetical protein